MQPSEQLGCEGIKAALEHYMMFEGRPIVDSIINTVGHSLSIIAAPGDGSKPKEDSVFELFGVPVFQVMTTMQSYEEWNCSVRDLTVCHSAGAFFSRSLTASHYIPHRNDGI
jgi:cobaltochelatase CobN